MIRLMRLSANDLAPQVSDALSELGALLKELKVEVQISSFIADYTNVGDYLNFNSNISGALQEVPLKHGVPTFYQDQLRAAQNYTYMADKLIEALKNKFPDLVGNDDTLNLLNKDKLSAPEFLYALVSCPQYMVVINNREPIIIPFFSKEHFNQTTQNPQESLNAVKTIGATSAILASIFASGEAEAARIGALIEPQGKESVCKVDSSFSSQEVDSSFSNQDNNILLNNNNSDKLIGLNLNIDDNGIMQPKSLDNNEGVVEPHGAITSNLQEQSTLSSPDENKPASDSGAITGLSRFTGCLIPSLIALLLLLALLAFYFFKIYPWPFDKPNKDDLLLDQLNEQVIKDELNLNKINDLIEMTKDKMAQSQLDEQNQQLANLKDTVSKDEQTLQDIEHLMSLLKDKEAQIELEAKEKDEPEEPVAQDSEIRPKGNNNLPKCETIIKQGKMPNLIIATDGSGSMINDLPDGTMRIEASIKAAHALIDHVDKNVPIRLFGIQGCPLARDYGTFSGKERAQLKNAVVKTNPFLVKGVHPFEVLTPLVSGMRGMASAAPKNADAIGVLISDGVDTCDGTENLNICNVAREIHKTKPRLKIHVVLIGQDAPDAKCVADITGGKLYRPENTKDLIKDLKNAGQSLQKVCH